MDFEGFLWACLGDELIMIIRNHFESYWPLSQAMHQCALQYDRKNFICGGMAECVLQNEVLLRHSQDMIA